MNLKSGKSYLIYNDSDNVFIKYFNGLPKSRYYTLLCCLDEIEKNNMKKMEYCGKLKLLFN